MEKSAHVGAEGTGGWAVAFSPDQKTVAVGCDDGSIHLLEVAPGK